MVRRLCNLLVVKASASQTGTTHQYPTSSAVSQCFIICVFGPVTWWQFNYAQPFTRRLLTKTLDKCQQKFRGTSAAGVPAKASLLCTLLRNIAWTAYCIVWGVLFLFGWVFYMNVLHFIRQPHRLPPRHKIPVRKTPEDKEQRDEHLKWLAEALHAADSWFEVTLSRSVERRGASTLRRLERIRKSHELNEKERTTIDDAIKAAKLSHDKTKEEAERIAGERGAAAAPLLDAKEKILPLLWEIIISLRGLSEEDVLEVINTQHVQEIVKENSCDFQPSNPRAFLFYRVMCAADWADKFDLMVLCRRELEYLNSPVPAPADFINRFTRVLRLGYSLADSDPKARTIRSAPPVAASARKAAVPPPDPYEPHAAPSDADLQIKLTEEKSRRASENFEVDFLPALDSLMQSLAPENASRGVLQQQPEVVLDSIGVRRAIVFTQKTEAKSRVCIIFIGTTVPGDTPRFAAPWGNGPYSKAGVFFRTWFKNLSFWKADPLDCFGFQPGSNAYCHSGMQQIYGSLRDNLMLALDSQCPGWKLGQADFAIIGHSLGGALAQFCAVDLAAQDVRATALTAAAPAVFNAAAVRQIETRINDFDFNHYRFHNQDDAAVWAFDEDNGIIFLRRYCHIGKTVNLAVIDRAVVNWKNWVWHCLSYEWLMARTFNGHSVGLYDFGSLTDGASTAEDTIVSTQRCQ